MTYYYAPETQSIVYRHLKVQRGQDETIELLRM